MFLLSFIRPLPVWVKGLVDPALLVTMLAPILYFFVVRPLTYQLTLREQAETKLRTLATSLEQQVLQRTGDLEKSQTDLSNVLEDYKKSNEAMEQKITEHGQAEKALQQRTHDLGERVKELTGLYSISRILERHDIPLEKYLELIVEVFPPAWQYSEITCARIIFNGREFITENFRETIWRQASDLIVHGERAGLVEVFYLEERPELDEGPFLKEERNLIADIAVRLGETIKRKQAEAQLEAAEARYRDLYNNAPDMYVSFDQQTATIIECNQTLATAAGYTREEIIGRSIFDMYHPDGVENAKKVFQLFVKKGEIKNAELQLQRKDGSKIEVSVNILAVRDEEGKILYCKSSWRDISDRKQMESETRQLREELIHVERVSTVGEMTAALANELNLHLSKIASYAYGCINRLNSGNVEPDKLLATVEMIPKQAGQASDLITHIRNFVRKEKPHREILEVNQLVREIVNLIIAEAHASETTIILNLNDNLPMIKGNPIKLQQVILNLVRNGIEAMSETDLSSRQITITTSVHSDSMVVVTISDGGPGVSPEEVDNMFIPFFTTKIRGLGLGLTICRSIVEENGGKIWFNQDVTMGTAVSFTVPISDKAHLPVN